MRKRNLFSQKQTIDALKYIAESPRHEFGGFHPTAVKTAKSALYHIDWLIQECHHERAKNFCLSPEVKRSQDKIRELRKEIATIKKSMATL